VIKIQLKILDTGYISATTALVSQTQLSVANRAGYDGSSSVSAFTLNTDNDIIVSRATNLEDKPDLGARSDSEVTLISVGNLTLNVSFTIEKTITTSGYDTNDIYQLSRFDLTDGLKLLYPSNITEIDKYRNIVEALGAVNTGGVFSDASPTDTNGTVSTTTPYLIGRIKNLSIRDSTSTTHWKISFIFEVSN
jgi:hypothetical protein